MIATWTSLAALLVGYAEPPQQAILVEAGAWTWPEMLAALGAAATGLGALVCAWRKLRP